MSNESEIKALFFAQYYGQRIFQFHKQDEFGPYVLQGSHLSMANLHGCYIELRTVDMLTGDEISQCVYLNWPDKIGSAVDIVWAKAIIGTIANKSVINDYLRLIGVVQPFTYLSETGQPITLSVDELVAKGWVKIVAKN